METLRHGYRSAIALFTVLVLFALSSGSSWAQVKIEDGRVATVDQVIGKVYHKYIDRDGKQVRKHAARGEAIWETDIVETEADARVKLVFVEGDGKINNVVVLGPDSYLRIDRASNGKNHPGTQLQLKRGSVQSIVNRKYSGEGKDVFQVKTPAVIAGVRGTIFLVEHDEKAGSSSSNVATLAGSVMVAPVGNLAASRLVNKGMHVSAVKDHRGSAVLGRVAPISENSRLLRRIKIFQSKMPVSSDQVSHKNPYGLTPGLVLKGKENELSRSAMEKARANTQDKRLLEGVKGVNAASTGTNKLPLIKAASKEPASILRVPTRVPSAERPQPVEAPKVSPEAIRKTGLSGGLQ